MNMDAGDFDLVVDPVDGKGCYYFERVHSELVCADLTADYAHVTGYSTHFPRRRPRWCTKHGRTSGGTAGTI
ncbi:hypothetical protein ABZ636_33035 [Streptomyces sp. NPDC007251]|uniref:hypothetical protein n=1 Tax=Streptomyces sp. NPDC007251 TaxID=3154483 RepID=UPI0033D6A766